MIGRMRKGIIAAAIICSGIAAFAWWNPLPLQDWLRDPRASFFLAAGGNPHPVILRRPPRAPLSAMAALGKKIFFDPSLSSSGRLACVSCHDPRHDYGPPGGAGVMAGGPDLASPGSRAVPSLKYLERQPGFSIGPEQPENESGVLPVAMAAFARAGKSALAPAAASANLVPEGGLFWDGRADTLQNQALIPLTNPQEMDGGGIEQVAQKLARAPYASGFAALFGQGIFSQPRLLASEAMFAVARFEIEDESFHPYASKYDAWLEGKARLSRAELRGYLAFNDPAKGNCAACHLSQAGPDGLPPLFTDHQFEALGVPRNSRLAANRDADYFDLGLCGPYRGDLKDKTFCGFFATPSLRNAAARPAFFHNGVYASLRQVLDFYNFRSADPARIYPVRKGVAQLFDDLPPAYRANVDRVDAPFSAARAPMRAAEEDDIIAFLKTLKDETRWAGAQ